MSFVAPAHLELAIRALEQGHFLQNLDIPSLLHAAKAAGVAGVGDTDADAVAYGSAPVRDVLQEYFAVPGAPDPQKPCRSLWSGTSDWVDLRKSPGGNFQRQRDKRRGEVFHRFDGGNGVQLWSVASDGGEKLLPATNSVPLIALSVWYGREQDVASLQELQDWFLAEFPVNQGDLVGTIYSNAIPQEYEDIALSNTPITLEELAEAVGAVEPTPPINLSLDELVDVAEAAALRARFNFPRSLFERVIVAWLRGDMVVLVGAGGTGKTAFSTLLTGALEEVIEHASVTVVPIGQDFDETDLIGYQRLDNTMESRQFAQSVLLSDRPLAVHMVVLEELNVTAVEQYLQPLLIAVEHPSRVVRLPNGTDAFLPVDTFFIATANSPLDEPESRLKMSYPTKRRFSTIVMPNILFQQWEDDPAVLKSLVQDLIGQAHQAIVERSTAGLASSSDALRVSFLDDAVAPDFLTDEVVDGLQAVTKAVFSAQTGQSFFTMGILRDIALALAFSDNTAEGQVAALGAAVEDKLMEQVRGSKAYVASVVAALAFLPNHEAIEARHSRMSGGLGDEVVSLL